MTRPRIRARGRRDGGTFVPLPNALLDSPNFIATTPRARALLFDLIAQIRIGPDGWKNNGNLSAAWSIVSARGWTSRDQLELALAELEHFGLVLRTRQGGRNRPTLFAVTWLPISDNEIALDVRPTRTPPGTWKRPRPAFDPATWRAQRRRRSGGAKKKSLTRQEPFLDPPDGSIASGAPSKVVALTRGAGQSGEFVNPPHGLLLRSSQGAHPKCGGNELVASDG